MITTVTLNAALDKVYTLPDFKLDQVHRPEHAITVPGGKGINAARVLRLLGAPVGATGIVAGHTGRQVLDGLRSEGIAADFVEAAHGETRLAITVLGSSPSTQTELIEAGPPVTRDELAALRRKVMTLARSSAWVVFSGSLPQGCPAGLYAELIALAKAQGARTALDASGEALAQGLQGGPDLVKPNAEEAARYAGVTALTPDTAKMAATQLVKAGAKLAVISLGADGAVAASADTLYRVEVPAVSIVSPLGSGDAMVAGMVAAALKHPTNIQAILRQGAACGTSAALHPMAGVLSIEDVTKLEQQISVQQE
ncbi:1-phosphofructokinase family hexose kinase [Paenibacillus polygoni]|uniref:Tagatose-6-phosphate kinase n=1 Tax=Paenibacillus polygoni TaxID=3050112 RepID=A0ABY8X971_9BACL|nr:1-phosphofructokinase family hexose kinase [Paenibacillus polygoni]WIV21618.1 1-phosphofructokinase family hexose kinase [Paenibacillus polygoni]